MIKTEVLRELREVLEDEELKTAERLLAKIPDDDFSKPEVFRDSRGEVYAIIRVPVPAGAARFAFSEFFFVLWITAGFVSLRWKHVGGGENGHTL